MFSSGAGVAFFLVHVGRGGRGGWWVHKAQDSGYGQGFGKM